MSERTLLTISWLGMVGFFVGMIVGIFWPSANLPAIVAGVGWIAAGLAIIKLRRIQPAPELQQEKD